MPNKVSSRTRRARRGPRTSSSKSLNLRSAPGMWAPSGSGPEVKSVYVSFSNNQLYHNVWSLINSQDNLFSAIGAGTGAGNRIGNKIFVEEIDFCMMLNNKDTRSNVTYRVCVLAAPASPGSDTSSELIVYNNFTGFPNLSSSVVMHDSVFPSNQGSTMTTPTKERSHVFKCTIPVKRPVIYGSDGLAQTRLIVLVCAYDAFGSLTTDNIASIPQAGYRIIFTDV